MGSFEQNLVDYHFQATPLRYTQHVPDVQSMEILELYLWCEVIL